MSIKFFFFTLFQNFMVPLDSSWWDLFKSAESPQFMINLPSLFGTYLWIFFIFTSVPILKKKLLLVSKNKNMISSDDVVWSPFICLHSSDFNNLNGACQTQELVQEYLFFQKKEEKKVRTDRGKYCTKSIYLIMVDFFFHGWFFFPSLYIQVTQVKSNMKPGQN